MDGAVSILAGLAILVLLPVIKILPQAVVENIKPVIVLKPWQDRLYIKFLLLTIGVAVCFFLMFRVVPLFYKEVWHINELWIGLILGLNGVIIALFEMIMVSRIENKRPPVYYIVRGILFLALGYLVLMLPGIRPVGLAVVSIILFTFGEMFALPFINSFVMNRANVYNRGQYAAGYTLSWSIPQVIGPSAGFYLAERLGYNWFWAILILLLLLCAWGFQVLGRNMN